MCECEDLTLVEKFDRVFGLSHTQVTANSKNFIALAFYRPRDLLCHRTDTPPSVK